MAAEEEYKQTGIVDAVKMSSQFQEAKGQDVTWTDFAKKCGISTPTMSRIINKKIIRPLSIELLKAVALNSITQNVTIDSLAKANGMTPRLELQSEGERMCYMEQCQETEQNYDYNMRSLLLNALADRGSALQIVKGEKVFSKENEKNRKFFNFGVLWDYIIKTDAFKSDGIRYWGIVMYAKKIEPEEDSAIKEQYFTSMVRTCSPIFLYDTWEPEPCSMMKTSFVFTDPYLYNKFLKEFGGRLVNNQMSIVLMNLSDKTIVEEKAFQRNNGKSCLLLTDIPEVNFK